MNQRYHVVMNYSQINDYIFVGTNMCCQMHFDQKLKSKGIEADISLEEERIDNPNGLNYFLWLPTKDHTAPSQSQLSVGVDALNALVNEKVKTYIHCKNGHGRAPTLVAAYLIKHKNMSVHEAIKTIKENREEIHITKDQNDALVKFIRTQK